MTTLYQRLGLPWHILLQREVVRLFMPCDVYDVSETLCGDHSNVGTFVGECGVGRDGSTMDKLIDFRQWHISFVTESYQTIKNCLGWVVRGGRDFFDNATALIIISIIEVSESSTNVDADSLHEDSFRLRHSIERGLSHARTVMLLTQQSSCWISNTQ